MTDNDKLILRASLQQLCRKGAHSPDEAQILLAFTQLVERACKPQAVEAKDTPKEATGK